MSPSAGGAYQALEHACQVPRDTPSLSDLSGQVLLSPVILRDSRSVDLHSSVATSASDVDVLLPLLHSCLLPVLLLVRGCACGVVSGGALGLAQVGPFLCLTWGHLRTANSLLHLHPAVVIRVSSRLIGGSWKWAAALHGRDGVNCADRGYVASPGCWNICAVSRPSA